MIGLLDNVYNCIVKFFPATPTIVGMMAKWQPEGISVRLVEGSAIGPALYVAQAISLITSVLSRHILGGGNSPPPKLRIPPPQELEARSVTM